MVATWLAALLLSFSGISAQQSIVSFGAVSGVESLAAARTNGAAIAAAVHAANESSATGANRTVLIPAGENFWVLPATSSTGFLYVSNVTIQLDGTLSAYTTNFSVNWPADPVTRNPADVLHFEDSEFVTITGSGLIEGNGYDCVPRMYHSGSHSPKQPCVG